MPPHHDQQPEAPAAAPEPRPTSAPEDSAPDTPKDGPPTPVPATDGPRRSCGAGSWRTKYRNRLPLCLFRAPPHPLDRRDASGPFPLLDLPADIFPLVFRYLHDCELAKLASACKCLRRACGAEFAYRERRLESEWQRDPGRPGQAVAEVHDEMEALYAVLGRNPLLVVRLNYKGGYPQPVLRSCGVM